MTMTVQDQLALIRRGTAEIISEEELGAKLERAQQTGQPLRVKLGIDPTSPDIHLGFAVVLRKLRQFQDLGHDVIVIIGDFTAMIGDPSGKTITRPQLSAEEVRENARTYEQQYSKILDPSRTQVVFNGQWLGAMTFAEVIHLTSHATVAQILERDDFAKRYAEHRSIAIHEFLYSFCQAYDSVYLKADVEMGGTDQKFNILLGRHLQREYAQEPQVTLLMPLLVGLDGVQKMSKSLGNTVGISEPPSQIFGKLMSIPDDRMPTYFELATEMPMDRVQSLLAGHPMTAKKALAHEIVRLYHGESAAEGAQAEFERVFSEHELPEEMPEVRIPRTELKEDLRIWIGRLITLAGLAGGSREARRLVEQGAVTLDGDKVVDPNADVEIKPGVVLRVGRRKFARLTLD
jgi:tyrosyl-tRNA synthetase